jgi:hypothetical protein
MRKLVIALAMTLAPVAVNALELNPVKTSLELGVELGRAEAYAAGCATGMVDPKVKQSILDAIPRMYQDAYKKGVRFGIAEANAVVAQFKAPRPTTEAAKRCVMGVYLYGPEGKIIRNLIIPLR